MKQLYRNEKVTLRVGEIIELMPERRKFLVERRFSSNCEGCFFENKICPDWRCNKLSPANYEFIKFTEIKEEPRKDIKMKKEIKRIPIPKDCEVVTFIKDGELVCEFTPIKKCVKQIVDEFREKVQKTYFITSTSSMEEVADRKTNTNSYKNSLYTTEKCEQFLALMELTMNNWIVNGERELERNEIKAGIYRVASTDLLIASKYEEGFKKTLNFKDMETAEEFFKTYEELIKKAGPLL